MPDLDRLSRSQLLLQYLCAMETLTADNGARQAPPDTAGASVRPDLSRGATAPPEI